MYRLNLDWEDSSSDVLDIKHAIQAENLTGLRIQEISSNPEDGTMGGELLPFLELIISPAVSVAVATGIFKVIRDYIEFKKVELQTKSEDHKITLSKIVGEDQEEKIEIHSFDEEERKKIVEFFLK